MRGLYVTIPNQSTVNKREVYEKMWIADDQLISQDLKHNWHPCIQMKDCETFKPTIIARTEGSYIYLRNGSKLIDANASWWCKTLGHQHERLKGALCKQIAQFEHVLFANTTNEVIINLSTKLVSYHRTLDKVFYASEGSSAIEIAMKMSLHTRKIRGENQRTRFIALENGYHGETIGALSVSDIGIYKKPYEPLLFDPCLLTDLPYIHTITDPTWLDCSAHWERIERQLMPYAEEATAIIVEPILQGAGGMRIYSQDLLRRLRKWSDQHNVHLIADEIMTGIGRTGKMFACEYAEIEPDFLCLSKGLTAGWFPLSTVLTTTAIYNHFYDDHATQKAFLHSHTHSGNVLGAALALEVLTIMEEENYSDRANELGKIMSEKMQYVAKQTQCLSNVRGLGAVVAADLICDDPKRRIGHEVFQQAVSLGALLRPLGNTIYWLPPLTTSFATIDELADITERAIKQVMSG